MAGISLGMSNIWNMPRLNLSAGELRILVLLLVIMTLAFSWRIMVNSPSLYFALTGPPPHRVVLTPGDGDGPEVAPGTDPSFDEAVFIIDQEGIWVQIEGQVRQPGVYRVQPGTRLFMLLEHAGGILGEAVTADLNLTEELRDGQRIAIPGAPMSRESGDGRIDINSSSAERLQELPGIGPVLAERIIEYRQRHGGFHSVEELIEVSGIGAVTLDQLRDLITAQ